MRKIISSYSEFAFLIIVAMLSELHTCKLGEILMARETRGDLRGNWLVYRIFFSSNVLNRLTEWALSLKIGVG